MIALFMGLVSGALVLGYWGEKKGLLPICKVVVFGTILPCVLMFILSLQDDHLISSTKQLFCIRYINAFFHPAAYVVTSIVLMRMYEKKIHLKISAYITLAAISGMQVAYSIANFQENNLFLFCLFLLGTSVLAAFLCITCVNGIDPKMLGVPPAQSKAKLSDIFLALCIGSVFNTSIRYHYFFVDKHVMNTLLTQHNHSFGYVFFYLFLGIFLFIYANLFKQKNQLEILSSSLIGILLVGIAPAFISISSLFYYTLYQVILAIFVAGFLATSIAVVYSLFEQHSNTVFHAIMWFSTGYAIGNFMSDWIAEKYGFFICINSLSMLPLMLSGFGCLTVLVAKIDKIPIKHNT